MQDFVVEQMVVPHRPGLGADALQGRYHQMPEQFHREVADEDDACDEQDARALLSAGVVQPRAAEQRCQVLVQIVHAGSQF